MNQPKIVRDAQNRARGNVYAKLPAFMAKGAVAIEGGANPKKVNQRLNRLKGIYGYKKGGPVKKTGIYRLHKGEHVLTKKQKEALRKAADKLMT